MRKFVICFVLLFALFFSSISLAQQNVRDLSITILFDNYLFKEGLSIGWGFSCLVEGTEKTILFDIGSVVVRTNMEKLGINPKVVNVVVFSHIHPDHTDGAMSFWAQNSNVTVYIPESWPENVRKAIKNSVMGYIETIEPLELCDGVYLTDDLLSTIGGGSGTVFGVFGSISETREQALAIKTSKGLVIITGCAHPGVVKIVQRAKEITKEKDVYLLIGGFHLLDMGADQVKNIINELKNENVKKVSPTHCTGDSAIALFKQEYGDNYVPAGVGNKIMVNSAFLQSTAIHSQGKLATIWASIRICP
jgi:7,8-dihydropterin-6-yl-methyl-4-(beta-D-ribofuranosyl)aminobenzene 5'-phosphate synthase